MSKKISKRCNFEECRINSVLPKLKPNINKEVLTSILVPDRNGSIQTKSLTSVSLKSLLYLYSISFGYVLTAKVNCVDKLSV